jgi:hydroxyethylthiazole kinase-like uncharacterized protein yjeF
MTTTLLTADHLRRNPLPRHDEGGGKESRGRVLIVGGSTALPGASLLAGLGALRAGAGILQLATCRSVATQLALAIPEAMVVGCRETDAGGIAPDEASRIAELARNVDAVLIGPGMSDLDATRDLVFRLITDVDGPLLVLDAMAFTSLKDQPDLLQKRPGRIAVTPHAGEMATFLGVERSAVEADALDAARRAHRLTGAVIAMKGVDTYVVGAEQAWLSRHGSLALATSGSGDTLAGILVGLLARGTTPLLSVLWAVHLHAAAGERLAGRYGRVGALAREIPAEVPMLMEELLT